VGPNTPENVITLCDLCHAVVTRRWHRPWFGDLTQVQSQMLETVRQEFMEFFGLDEETRTRRQALLWVDFGISKN
jgi:hypothetical protein